MKRRGGGVSMIVKGWGGGRGELAGVGKAAMKGGLSDNKTRL